MKRIGALDSRPSIPKADSGGHHRPEGIPKESRRRWRRAMVATSVIVSLALMVFLTVPPLLTATRLRNHLLGSAFASSGLTCTCESASGGWLTPVVLNNVVVNDPDGASRLRVSRVAFSRGLLGLLFSPSDFGVVKLQIPRLDVWIDDSQPKKPNWEVFVPAASGRLEFYQSQLTVFLRSEPVEPVMQLITGETALTLGPDETGRHSLILEECWLQKDEFISQQNINALIQMAAPVLSQVTELKATASIRIDRIVIPEPAPGEFTSPLPPVTGTAVIHLCEARLLPEWTTGLLTGISVATQTDLPSRLTVARDTEIAFRVDSRGVTHDSMSFLLPEIAPNLVVETSGTVRFDRSLDLDVRLRLPPQLSPELSWAPDLWQAVEPLLTARVTGTVFAPEIDLRSPAELLTELSRNLPSTSGDVEAAPVTRAVLDVVIDATQQDPDEARRDLPRSILQLIRSIEAAKRERAGGSPAAPKPPKPGLR